MLKFLLATALALSLLTACVSEPVYSGPPATAEEAARRDNYARQLRAERRMRIGRALNGIAASVNQQQRQMVREQFEEENRIRQDQNAMSLSGINDSLQQMNRNQQIWMDR
jgi:TolA-binding protein